MANKYAVRKDSMGGSRCRDCGRRVASHEYLCPSCARVKYEECMRVPRRFIGRRELRRLGVAT